MGKHTVGIGNGTSGNGLTLFQAGEGRTPVWKKRIGGRTFYFGSEYEPAAAEASAIKARWRRLAAEGHQAWPQGEPNRLALQDALGIGPGLLNALAAVVGQPKPLPTATELVSADSIKIEQAGKIYLDELAKGGEAGARWLRDVSYRLGKGLDVLGREKGIGEIGQAELIDFAAHWRGRPFKVDAKGHKTKEQVSLTYSKYIVDAVKRFLDWASEHQDISWPKPVRFDKILTIRPSRISTIEQEEAAKAEHLGKESKFFDLADLRTLYQGADAPMRAYIMLAMNCGYANGEVAHLKATDIKTVGGVVSIETLRHKTIRNAKPVPSKHVLWPETVKAIRAVQAPANEGGFFFLTERGKPLVSGTYDWFPTASHADEHRQGVAEASCQGRASSRRP